MYDLAIAIIGSGDTTYNNVSDLLTDYLPASHIVYIPSYINSEGMKTTWKFLADEGINYERVKKSELIEILKHAGAKSRQLVILNSDGIENEISYCLKMKIPVFDLTRGLYQVTEVPLYGAESHAEAVSKDSLVVIQEEQGDSLTEPLPPRACLWCGDSIEGFRSTRFYCSERCTQLSNQYSNPKAKFLIQYKDWNKCTDCGLTYPYYVLQFDHVPGRGKKLFNISLSDILGRNVSQEMIETEMSKCDLVCANCHADRTHRRFRTERDDVKMRTQITTGETNWEPQNNILPEEDVLGAGETGFRTGIYDPDAANKTPYWKSKRGKYRKAGKSKARPGETLVKLTQEEIDKLE